jgi:hypothetical protein
MQGFGPDVKKLLTGGVLFGFWGIKRKKHETAILVTLVSSVDGYGAGEG